MATICFPHHTRGEFDSLKEAVHCLKRMNYGWSWYTLSDIVQYNVCYRDHLRQFGMKSLVDRLTEEAPELKNDQTSLDSLIQWWNKTKQLADYDIQCHAIEKDFTVLGHTFHGLKDVIDHREIIGKGLSSRFESFTPGKNETYPDIHIGEIYESYPIFDSEDLGDNRTYQNYIFRETAITADHLKQTSEMRHEINFCMVHEHIPEDRLPILYYGGDGQYMLLATAKENQLRKKR